MPSPQLGTQLPNWVLNGWGGVSCSEQRAKRACDNHHAAIVMNDPPAIPNSELRIPHSPVPVPLPDLGTAGEPVRVSAWFVEIGELVETGEPILEVLTPGVTCDVCSPTTGRISRLVKDLDASVLPGEVVAWIEPDGTSPVSGA